MNVATLRTHRLLLRPFEPGDLDELAALYADPEVVRYLGDGSTSTRDETNAWLERCLAHYGERGFGQLCVRRLEDDAFVGRCGLVARRIEGVDEVEVGYVLARASWGNGFATEAAAATRDHGFGALGLARIIALIQHANEASTRVARKIGMDYERDVEFGAQWERFGRRVALYAMKRSSFH